MTYHRKHKPRRTPQINPEVEAFLRTTGPLLLREFLMRYINGQRSLRGRHYDTQPDPSFHSAESQIYHDRSIER